MILMKACEPRNFYGKMPLRYTMHDDDKKKLIKKRIEQSIQID